MKTRWYKIVVWISIGIVALFFIFAVWYNYEYSMAAIAPYSKNSSALETKLLIATQGSDFKNTLTQGVVDYYKSDSVFIKVVDVSALNEIISDEYDAILVIHTWEYGKPPEPVQLFIDENSDSKNKIVVMTTSGEGSEKIENTDAISGESILEDAPDFVDNIIARLNPILETENSHAHLQGL